MRRTGKRKLIVSSWVATTLLWVAMPVAAMPFAAYPSAEPAAAVSKLVDSGAFQQATTRIEQALEESGLSRSTQRALAFQKERMRRIRMDFSLTRAELRERVEQYIPDLSTAEFDRWDQAGLFEHRVIDGRKLYFQRSPSNLFRLSEEALARRAVQTPLSDHPVDNFSDYHRRVRIAARESGSTSVLPQRVRVSHSLTVDADAVPAGETLRVWLPYPQEIAGRQTRVELVRSEPARHRIAPATTPQRTVYLEKTAVAGHPTQFAITYEVNVEARYHELDPARAEPLEVTPALARYVAERPPHIVFTDAMRAFSRKVVGDETNPVRIARKLFAAVDRIPWAGALEYSTISNISDYALHAGHADCGQQTLLLMTLLRLNGIPVHWQSGWTFSAGSYSNIHDWAMAYLEPWGWVPVDVTYGRMPDAPSALEWFYLGSIDNYRIAFNSDYGRPLLPAKQHFRSDTVDSQRGEVEWDGGNLYYEQWDYDFAWQILPPELPEPNTTKPKSDRER